MKKSMAIKIVSIVVGCVFLDIALHIATSRFSTTPDNPLSSPFSVMVGTEVTAFVWALSAFSVVAFVFLHISDEIPAEGVGSGLRYGAVVALLWALGMLEGVPLFGHPVINEFVVGLSDAVPVFLAGVLLSLLKTGNVVDTGPASPLPRGKSITVLIFAGIFVTGRYIAYASGLIRSGIQDMPMQTFIWTLMMGIAIGLSYVLLGAHLQGKSVSRRAMKFGCLVFGLNWAVFLVFMPLLFSGYGTDVLARIILDVTLVAFGSYLAILPTGVCMRNPVSGTSA